MDAGTLIAIVTAPRATYADTDAPALVEALLRAGVSSTLVPWYQPGVDWSQFRSVIVKSPFDCDGHGDAFLAWLDELEAARAHVLNPLSILRWNFDKRYLAALSAAGVPVVPTSFVEVGDEPHFPEGEFVVKPVISGGSRNTARYQPDECAAAHAHVRTLHAAGLAVMLQPYAEAIETVGERALIFYNGTFDHAIRKDAILKVGQRFDAHDREAHPNPRPYAPSDEELAVAKRALAQVPDGEHLLYARVDMTHAPDGSPLVMELELLNPVLFFPLSPGSAERYAAAIAARLP
jgi:glutathione synthase/RimK-type ligase-like ATP-grasp enzyme